MNENVGNRSLLIAGLSLALVGGFYLLREHWGHALGLLPYLILLACPLLHLFHGHGAHGAKRTDDHAANGYDPNRS